MEKISEIEEAVIQVKDGAIHIYHGNINSNHDEFHDRVTIEYLSGGNEIRIRARIIRKKTIIDDIDETHESFQRYCEQLKGFKERVETYTPIVGFFKRIFKGVKSSHIKIVREVSHYVGTKYSYFPELWKPVEYQSNNWVITEYKK